MKTNNKEDKKKKLFIVIGGGIVGISLIVAIVIFIVKTISGDRQEEYSQIPGNLMTMNLDPQPIEEKNKIEIYGQDLSTDKSDGGLSFEEKNRPMSLSLEDNLGELKNDTTVPEQKPTALGTDRKQVKQAKANVRKTNDIKPVKEQSVVSPLSAASSDETDILGKTIVFSDISDEKIIGKIKACINHGGIISSGDIIQVRLLEPLGDLPKNSLLNASCQFSKDRLLLNFDNIQVKAYDMDGKEGLSIADSQIRDGVNLIRQEAENTLQTQAQAVDNTLGKGVRLLTRVFNSNRNKNSRQSVEVPSAYVVYLKTY